MPNVNSFNRLVKKTDFILQLKKSTALIQECHKRPIVNNQEGGSKYPVWSEIIPNLTLFEKSGILWSDVLQAVKNSCDRYSTATAIPSANQKKGSASRQKKLLEPAQIHTHTRHDDSLLPNDKSYQSIGGMPSSQIRSLSPAARTATAGAEKQKSHYNSTPAAISGANANNSQLVLVLDMESEAFLRTKALEAWLDALCTQLAKALGAEANSMKLKSLGESSIRTGCQEFVYSCTDPRQVNAGIRSLHDDTINRIASILGYKVLDLQFQGVQHITEGRWNQTQSVSEACDAGYGGADGDGDADEGDKVDEADADAETDVM